MTMPRNKLSRNAEGCGQTETLKSLCEKNAILRGWFKPGIQAVKKEYRIRIKFPDTKKCGGSVDFDEALKERYSQENRWDYGIEYDGNLIFIEFHPAKISEVPCMVRKVDFFRGWLSTECCAIAGLPHFEKDCRKYYWVASGKDSLKLLPSSRYARQMASRHIVAVGEVFDYAKIERYNG